MHYKWMLYWMALRVVLASVIVVASLAISRQRYWVAVLSFALMCLGSLFFTVYPILFGIGMANAFGPRDVYSMAYLRPALVTLAYGYAALSVFPFLSAKRARRNVVVLVGLVIIINLGAFIYTAFPWPAADGRIPQVDIGIICYLLLWLRIYDLRMATEKP